MPDPTTQEQAPENNKPKQSAYLVCEGALCQCTGGAAPVKLKVTSHKKAYINAEKLLATEKDITFDQPGHFGTCSFKPPNSNACVPAVQQWMKPYKDIEVENQKALTDKSELLCSVGGKIAIKMHGQQQTVNAGQAENMDRSIAAQVNPLADLAPIAEADKKVSVNSITGKLVDDPKYKPVTTQNTQTIKSEKESKTDTDPADIYVRPGQEVEFTANTKAGGDTALVCWKVKGNEEPIYFLQHGPKYKASFPEVGKYTIEGYGTGGDSHLDVETKVVNGEEKERKEDTACMLDILVQNNKLTGIRHLPSVNVIDKTAAGKTEAQVRIGVPVTFEPVYLMAPIQEEIDHLILLIRDASGNEVQRETGKPNIVFAAQNSAATYKVEAYFDNSDAAAFTYTFRTVNNTVSVIATSGMQKENDKIRLGKTLTFSVSKYKFEDDTLDEELLAVEHGKIKWYENSEVAVATGDTYTKTYNREGKYIVKCGVTAVEKTWFTKGKDDADDWRFEVSNNYPTAIEQKTSGKAKIGKNSYFELKGIFPINTADAATIKWTLTGPESIDTTRLSTFIFVPKKKGTYTLSATMNGRTISKTFECLACEIIKGWWTDADGNMLTGDDDDDEPNNTIGFAGWDQEVVASFKHVGLNGEDVTLEVWDSDLRSNTSVFKKDIKVSDSYTVDTCSIKLDQKIRDKVKEKGWSEDGSLYFTVKAKNGLKVINDGMVLANHLKIDSTVRIKMYFADNNDKRRYSTASLDTPVYVQVKSTNLIGEDLEMQIWEWGYIYHNVLGSRTPFKVDKYGMASVKLNMEEFKSKLSDPNDSIQIFVKVFNKKTGKEQQSKSGMYKLTLYKTLNETAESSDTTKAFVLVDASESNTNKHKNCPNCTKDITLQDIKSICVDAKGVCMIKDDKMIKEALPILNKYLSKAHLDTCLRKAHLLAQIATESKFYSLKEDFTYKASDLAAMTIFKSTSEGKENAQLWGYKNNSSEMTDENRKKIASWMYQGDGVGDHNGGPDTEDGWNYRGRGFKQITWKENYKKISTHFNDFLKMDGDSDVDWKTNYEDLTNNSRDAMLSALAFWDWKKINNQADSGKDDLAVECVTKVINGGKNGLKERQRFFKEAIKVLKIDDCKREYKIRKDIYKTYDGKYTADKKTAYIDIIVPEDRAYEGLMVLFDDTGVLFSCYCLCHGTAGSKQLKTDADTPTGLWGTTYDKNAHNNHLSYGNSGLIYMSGETGNALESKIQSTPRDGIAIHCGHTKGWRNNTTPDAINDDGYLMVTHGCVRVYNADMAQLGEKYTALKTSGKTIKAYVENVRDITFVHDLYNATRDPDEPGIKTRGNQTTQ